MPGMKRPAIFLIALCALGALAQQAAEKAVPVGNEPHHHLVIENKFTKVYDVTVPPHSQTLLHQHNYDYVYVTLGAATIENDLQGRAPQKVSLQDGETRLSLAPFAHVAKNLGDQPFHNITIEVLKQGNRVPPKGPDPDNLLGKSVMTMVQSDTVKATEVTLAPGETLPIHKHLVPHLLVPVTDLELKSDSPGKPAFTFTRKAGQVAFVEGVLTHELTNVGKQTAKFVVVSFR